MALETSQDHNRNKSYKCTPVKSVIPHGGNDKTNASEVKMLSNVHFNISTNKIIYMDWNRSYTFVVLFLVLEMTVLFPVSFGGNNERVNHLFQFPLAETTKEYIICSSILWQKHRNSISFVPVSFGWNNERVWSFAPCITSCTCRARLIRAGLGTWCQNGEVGAGMSQIWQWTNLGDAVSIHSQDPV